MFGCRRYRSVITLVITTLAIVLLYNTRDKRSASVEVVKNIEGRGPHIQRVSVDDGDDVFCMETRPSLHADELHTKEDLSDDGCYCAVRNKTRGFDINYNIERSFVFGSLIERRNYFNVKRTVAQNNRIPLKFHLIWSQSVIPSIYVDNVKRFRTLHPEWEIHFWSLSHGRGVVKQLEPQLLPMYTNATADAIRADILRYILLYHYGGAYVDLDIEPKLPFDNLTTMGDCLLVAEPQEHPAHVLSMRSLLSNAIIFCKQKHPFMRYLLDHLLPIRPPTRRGGIINIAGPLYVTQIFNSFISEQQNNRYSKGSHGPFSITILRHEYFEPLVMKFIQPFIKRYCNSHISTAAFFVDNCMDVNARPDTCSELENKSTKKEFIFWMCVEWVLHGQENRDKFTSPIYAVHHHSGTRNPKQLEYKPEHEITRMLPSVKTHV